MTTEQVDTERKHLEGLLKDRINFYLVFASVFILGLSRIDDAVIRVAALGIMTVVSALIGLAVIRTHLLVQCALTDIKKDSAHPYTKYQNMVRFPGNANKMLIWVPVILTACFAGATVFYLWVFVKS